MTATVLPPRSRWAVCLAQVERARLQTALEPLLADATVEHRQHPQAGLGMLSLREPGQGTVFNLGEFPLTSVAVQIRRPDGSLLAGGCQLMSDDLDHCQELACADALLAAELSEAEALRACLQAGRAQLDAEQDFRSRLLHATAVHFDALEHDPEDD